MDKKDLINCLNKITPSNSEKQEMLYHIKRSKNGGMAPMKPTVKKRSAAAVAVIMLCTLMATTVSAFYLGWHEKLMEYLSPSKEQIEQLESAVTRPEVSVTNNDITITVKQTLNDLRGIYVLYEIMLPDGVEAEYAAWRMSNLSVQTEDLPKGSGFGSLSSNTLDSRGNKLTMLLFLKQDDTFGDGTAVIDFCDLELYADGVLLQTFNGIWHLEWAFEYDDTNCQEIHVKRQINLGENSIYVERISLSPMSICIFGEGDIALFEAYGYPVVHLRDNSRIDYGEHISANSIISMTDIQASGAGEMELYYRFDSIMNPDDILSVTIGTETITLK